MIVQIKCPHCGSAFESDAEERTIFCPQCEKEIALKTNPAPQPPPSTIANRLIACADCAQPMSRRALWCQQCGSLQGSLFRIIWKIMAAFWLVGFVAAGVGWLILQLIHALLVG